MSIKPFFKIWRNGQLSPFIAGSGLLKPFYRLVYLVAASDAGLFELLRGGPVGFEQLASIYCRDAKTREAFEAWLQMGNRLGLLELGARGYELEGLAKSWHSPRTTAFLRCFRKWQGCTTS